MPNFLRIFLNEHEHIARFSNLNCCTFKKSNSVEELKLKTRAKGTKPLGHSVLSIPSFNKLTNLKVGLSGRKLSVLK